jgi:hypothetical protein
VKAKIVNLDSGAGDLPIQIYFSFGLANPGSATPPLTLIRPWIVDVSKLSNNFVELSRAGSCIYANVQGVGVDDSNFIQLIDQTAGNAPLCEEIEILKYGLVKCWTFSVNWQTIIKAFPASGHHYMGV